MTTVTNYQANQSTVVAIPRGPQGPSGSGGGGGGGSATNLGETSTSTTVTITSSTGTSATIPAATVSLAGAMTAADRTKLSGLATVATSGSYADLSNKPTIPAAQVNSDWNASSGLPQILNKPTLATVATTGSYTDLSSKPTIPAAATDMTGATSGADGVHGLVPAPLAGQQTYFLRADGTWVAVSGGGGTPGGSSGQVQINNSGAFGGITVGGDATLNASTGALTVTKTNGTAFATVATSGSYADLSSKPFALLTNTPDQTISGGANVTALSLTAGNIAVDCGARPLQYISNTGAFTITAPANDGSCYLDIVNGTGAGAVTFSGFTTGSNTGDSLDTTSGHKFRVAVSRINGVSTYIVKALQ